MLRKLSIWPLTLACFLVIGHAVFPHTHQSAVNTPAQSSQLVLPLNEGLLSFFSQLFSQDLGDNHLEDFNHGSENVPEMVFVAQAFLHTLLYFDASEDENPPRFATPVVYSLLSCYVTKDAPLRAPPQA